MYTGGHPYQRVARRLTDLLAPLPTGQQPDNLPLAARHRILRLPVASLQLLHLQIRSYADPLSHVARLPRKLVSRHLLVVLVSGGEVAEHTQIVHDGTATQIEEILALAAIACAAALPVADMR